MVMRMPEEAVTRVRPDVGHAETGSNESKGVGTGVPESDPHGSGSKGTARECGEKNYYYYYPTLLSLLQLTPFRCQVVS